MSEPDDTIQILRTNLRNAASTFGESSAQYIALKEMVDASIARLLGKGQPQEHDGTAQPRTFQLAFRSR
ncbi:hypothetical protein P152DRAFT_480560 [Eremomyces bilateralis CBS 781.70]|uniref:Uncharacterized protein n=1 Tax=Eremomyces bilateralis CBS 781.70 TaxID=1392243 RepID=A0A6G1G8K9_9PEZI|nr:uncharacterized protein P152DRAFT_480560 [Eremomyces bilateralis CBS 781.70]KAF1814363.1 hypothetical protein P152DRAFT_480560 [Eremomyces bilateralis CBS 781.70]